MDTRETAMARLWEELRTGRVDEIGHFLLEYLAEWGPDHLDVQAAAALVFERQAEA